jgi:hypothetical protein
MNTPSNHFRFGAVLLGIAILSISAPATADIVHNDDVIITFSLCTGNDCVNGESFGFDTIRIKENNLRIHADDTSTSASFPNDDWRLIFNDSSNGGAEKFSIEHVTGGRIPFTIEGNAPSNALYVDDGGRVGFGTSTPVVDNHIRSGNTPTLRLEQDGSSGFTPQTWDLAGNETNFFVRDVTNGSLLPFRIRPDAPSNSIFVDTDGSVGLGTSSPAATLDVVGDAIISGNVSLGSSRALKDDLGSVDGSSLLALLSELPIHTWRYKTEDNDVRHIGPMAEDFYGTFGLSNDPHHLSIVDANGIALAAVQELHSQLQARDQEIAALMKRLAALEEKLEP